MHARPRRRTGSALALCLLATVAACGASDDVRDQVAARLASADAGTGPRAGQVSSEPSGLTEPTGSVDTTGEVVDADGAPGASTGASASPSGGAPPPPPAGGNGGATAPGVTETSISVGGTFFNGGFLDKYSQVAQQAAQAYFNYVNDQGGVYGRKIEFHPCDTAGQAQGTTSCLNQLIEREGVFTMGPSLDFNLDIVGPILQSAGVPWVGSSGLYKEEFGSPLMFPTQLRGADVGAHILKFAKDQLGAATVGISWVTIGAGPDCKQRVQELAPSLGVQVVAEAVNEDVNNGLTSQVQRISDARPDVVLFCNDPVNTVKFMQAAGSRGYQAPKGFVGGFVAADDVPEAMGRAGTGFYGFSSFDFYRSDSPDIQQYRSITESYYPRIFHHFYTQAAFTGAVAIVEALEAAGPNVTRESFVEALKGLQGFTSMGLPINFTDLGKGTSGVMLRADENLRWQPFAPRFTAV